MEGVWRMLGNRRAYGSCYISYPTVVHLCVVHYHGLPAHCVHGAGLLDEYEAVYIAEAQESAAVTPVP